MLCSIGCVVLYRYVPVPMTPLMVRNAMSAALKGDPITFHHDWVPMEKISPHLLNAVVASEDQRFYLHGGVDWKRTAGAFVNFLPFIDLYSSNQGGSTITQQLIKNVTSDKDKSAIRKLREIARALLIEKKAR